MLLKSPAWSRSAILLLTVCIAFGLTTWVPQSHEALALLSFMMVISLTAIFTWQFGLRRALIFCSICYMFINYFIYEPRFAITWTLPAFAPMVLFVLVALVSNSISKEMRRNEEQKLEQRRWFETILSSIGDAVIATDGEGKIGYVNAAAEELMGQSSARLRGRFAHEVLRMTYPHEEYAVALNMDEVLKGSRSLWRSDPMTLKCDILETSIEFTIAPIKNGEGSIQGLVLAIRDISERESARTQILAYQEDLRSLTSELTLAEERQRRQIAEGLHDRVTQSLALASIKLRTMCSNVKEPRMQSAAEEIHAMIKDVLTEIRSLTFELSPPILYEFGLEPALEWLCKHFEKNHQVACSFQCASPAKPLPMDVRVMLYQAVRELLTNVVKHANAQEMSVTVEKIENRIAVAVKDDGKGFEIVPTPSPSTQPQGFGLFSVREHIRNLGGSVSLHSSLGKGTQISLLVPIPA